MVLHAYLVRCAIQVLHQGLQPKALVAHIHELHNETQFVHQELVVVDHCSTEHCRYSCCYTETGEHNTMQYNGLRLSASALTTSLPPLKAQKGTLDSSCACTVMASSSSTS